MMQDFESGAGTIQSTGCSISWKGSRQLKSRYRASQNLIRIQGDMALGDWLNR